MDKEIKAYADAMYEQSLMDSVAALQKAKVEFLKRRTKHSDQLPVAGANIGAFIRFYVEHIERCMASRLQSFQNAYAEASQVPTEQELSEILRECQANRQRQAEQSSRAISFASMNSYGAAWPRSKIHAR